MSLNRLRLLLAHEAEIAAHTLVDRAADLRVLAQEGLDILAPLTEALAAVREPRAALLDDPLLDGQVEQVPSREMPSPYMSSSASRGAVPSCSLRPSRVCGRPRRHRRP
jgi:hypothetical protein